jgi:hypothetical protein
VDVGIKDSGVPTISTASKDFLDYKLEGYLHEGVASEIEQIEYSPLFDKNLQKTLKMVNSPS